MRDYPSFGYTRSGRAVHARTLDHHPARTAYQQFNRRLAIRVTGLVGSMTCAYAFTLLSLCSLPAVLSGFAMFHGWFPGWLVKASLIALVGWVAQTFIQLVLLSVIMVGQNVSSEASDARAEKTFEHTSEILDRLDVRTEGGLKDVLDAIERLRQSTT